MKQKKSPVNWAFLIILIYGVPVPVPVPVPVSVPVLVAPSAKPVSSLLSFKTLTVIFWLLALPLGSVVVTTAVNSSLPFSSYLLS